MGAAHALLLRWKRNVAIAMHSQYRERCKHDLAQLRSTAAWETAGRVCRRTPPPEADCRRDTARKEQEALHQPPRPGRGEGPGAVRTLPYETLRFAQEDSVRPWKATASAPRSSRSGCLCSRWVTGPQTGSVHLVGLGLQLDEVLEAHQFDQADLRLEPVDMLFLALENVFQ